jgi:hypothetical protein
MPGELIPIILFMSAAAVLIFRPLTTRIGRTIESKAEKKGSIDPQINRIMQLMERLVDRMDRLEDRVDFTERVLERQRMQAQLTGGGEGSEPERLRREGRGRDEDIL